MRKVIFISLIFTLILLNGCSIKKDINYIERERDIVYRCDNTTAKEQLVKHNYFIESGTDFIGTIESMEELNFHYKIECLRRIDEGYYAVYKVNNDEWLYILFQYVNGKYIISDTWHFERAIYKSDFETLVIGSSTIDDVRKVDSCGYEMLGLMTGRLPFSLHKTIDNCLIEITYTNNVISDISYTYSENVLSSFIIDIDIPD